MAVPSLTPTDPTADGPDDRDTGPKDAARTPQRRCLVDRQSKPKHRLIRFVVGPDGAVTPDLSLDLPGRGFYLSADRAILEKATAPKAAGLFARAARQPVKVPEDLLARLADLTADRVLRLVSLARRAGEATSGFDRVAEAIQAGRVAVLLAAADGAADGRSKLLGMARARGLGSVPVIDWLPAEALGRCFGRDHAVHGAISPGGLADKMIYEAARAAAVRGQPVTVIGAGPVAPAGDGTAG